MTQARGAQWTLLGFELIEKQFFSAIGYILMLIKSYISILS